MQKLVQFASAIADETRWRIIQLIADDALCVCELADILKMPQSSVSSHLQVIRKAELLDSERCEKWIYYRLSSQARPVVIELAKQFHSSPASDATLARDVKIAKTRLAQREESCCPGPRKLASNRRKGLRASA